MREIRTLRSMWRGLETGPQGYRASPRPYLGKGKPGGPQTPRESAHSDAGPYAEDRPSEDAICGG